MRPHVRRGRLVVERELDGLSRRRVVVDTRFAVADAEGFAAADEDDVIGRERDVDVTGDFEQDLLGSADGGQVDDVPATHGAGDDGPRFAAERN